MAQWKNNLGYSNARHWVEPGLAGFVCELGDLYLLFSRKIDPFFFILKIPDTLATWWLIKQMDTLVEVVFGSSTKVGHSWVKLDFHLRSNLSRIQNCSRKQMTKRKTRKRSRNRSRKHVGQNRIGRKGRFPFSWLVLTIMMSGFHLQFYAWTASDSNSDSVTS